MDLAPVSACDWCLGPMPPGARSDAETCSPECRQARHRFRVEPATEFGETPMHFGALDPPYIGCARRYYKGHPAYAGEVDHRELIERALVDFPDGWALCLSSKSIFEIAAITNDVIPADRFDDLRCGAWVKGSRACVSHRARDAWEPVILFGGRPRRMEPNEVLDNALVWGGRQHSHPGALVGMKPPAFSEWVFRQLGALRGDRLTDVFPGSGAIARAWKLYAGEAEPPQLTLFGPDPIPARSALPSRLAEANAKVARDEP